MISLMKIKFRINKVTLLSYILCATILPSFADVPVNVIEEPVRKPVVVEPKAITFVSPPVSHVTPAILNDTALRKWINEGNRSSALVLLERAHRLAPSNAVITHNLELVKKNALAEAIAKPPKYLTVSSAKKAAPVINDTNQTIWNLP
jgi:DNA helicase HerA-like ATPase